MFSFHEKCSEIIPEILLIINFILYELLHNKYNRICTTKYKYFIRQNSVWYFWNVSHTRKFLPNLRQSVIKKTLYLKTLSRQKKKPFSPNNICPAFQRGPVWCNIAEIVFRHDILFLSKLYIAYCAQSINLGKYFFRPEFSTT